MVTNRLLPLALNPSHAMLPNIQFTVPSSDNLPVEDAVLEMVPHLGRTQTWAVAGQDVDFTWKFWRSKANVYIEKYEFFWRFEPPTQTHFKWQMIHQKDWRGVFEKFKNMKSWTVPVLWMKVFFSFLFIYSPVLLFDWSQSGEPGGVETGAVVQPKL